jgi:hypothetical protein
MRAVPTTTFFNPSAANANWRNLNIGADSAAGAENAQGTKIMSVKNAQVGGDSAGQNIGIHATFAARLS